MVEDERIKMNIKQWKELERIDENATAVYDDLKVFITPLLPADEPKAMTLESACVLLKAGIELLEQVFLGEVQ